MSKEILRNELSGTLEADLAVRERAHKEATVAATHEEAKPENDKDTRALEQSYLARGEARRVEELRAALVELQSMPLRAFGDDEPVVLGALVTVEQSGIETRVWLAPQGGGTLLHKGAVRVVTPQSPLGQALLGKKAGDECEVVLAGGKRDIVIVRVS